MNLEKTLPSFKELALGQTGWTFTYNEEMESFLFAPELKLQERLMKLSSEWANFRVSFKRPFKVGSVYFTIGCFLNTKKLVLISHRGAREQILVEMLGDKVPTLQNILKDFESLDATAAPTVIELTELQYGLKNLGCPELKAVDKLALEIAATLGRHVNGYKKSLFEKISDSGLNLTATFALFRIHILKFLAILPSLDHDSSGREVKRVLLESLRRLLADHAELKSTTPKAEQIPSFYIVGIGLVKTLATIVPAGLLAGVVRTLVAVMAKRFIAGENIEKALITLKDLKQTKRDATLDQLGELVVSDKEADIYFEEVLKIIKGIKNEIKPGEKNASGINRAHVSIKVSALSPVFRPHAFLFTYNKVAPRLKQILLAAKAEQVFVNIDAEHYHYRDLVLDIYAKVLLETPELSDYSQTGIVLQCYLRDASVHLEKILKLAQTRKLMMPIRLVKGAYWDAETIEAEAHGYEAPQFLNKEETDIHYRQLVYKVMSSYPHLQVTIASHNIHDHAWSEALRTNVFPQTPVIEHQVLHMTYEALSHALAHMDYPVRNYMPIGGLLVGMAYLVRRIMENSSQVGILTQMRKKVDISAYKSPQELLSLKLQNKTLAREHHMEDLATKFKNTGPVILYDDFERSLFDQAHTEFKKELGTLKTDLNLNGGEVRVTAPFDPNITLGVLSFGDATDAQNAIVALTNESDWKKNPEFRISALLKTAALMIRERNRLAHIIVYEAGKTFAEALGDVDEAIDFLEYYARAEKDLRAEKLTHRNLVAVIAPWNFPLAIPCGMAAGALVAGNHVILKCAEQTPFIAWELTKLFYAAGVPKNVLAFLPGYGEVVGKYLVEHPQVEAVVFTGSKSVGEWIYKASFEKQVKHKLTYQPKVVAEMGGKNAIIVTANAELDETVSGILFAAFAHAGQKCSAASRIIVDSIIKDKLEARIKEAVKDIQVGPSSDPATFVNALISSDEKTRLQRQIAEATIETNREHGRVLIDRSNEDFSGAIMGPAVFSVPTKLAFKRDSYACRELFGPVIHLIPYQDLDEAVQIFNSTEYALTGGIYSQSQDDIDYLLSKLYCGNLYINRPNTGARVGIEPFGGFKMSGTGPKAGSKDYVRIFHKSAEEAVKMAEAKHGHEGGSVLLRESHTVVHSTFDERLDKLLRFLEVLINNESNFSTQLNLKQNLKFIEYWLKQSFRQYSFYGRDNTIIPGQLSFNDFKLSKSEFVVLSDSSSPSLPVLIQILAALTAGTRVTILVRNSEAAQGWNIFLNLSLLCDYDDSKLRLLHLERESFLRFLHESRAEVFYFDTQVSDFEVWYKVLFGREKVDYLPLIMTNLESNVSTHFEEVLHSFVLVRSMAVNIMRHGAPLSLEKKSEAQS